MKRLHFYTAEFSAVRLVDETVLKAPTVAMVEPVTPVIPLFWDN